jgi:hypothetical protein
VGTCKSAIIFREIGQKGLFHKKACTFAGFLDKIATSPHKNCIFAGIT